MIATLTLMCSSSALLYAFWTVTLQLIKEVKVKLLLSMSISLRAFLLLRREIQWDMKFKDDIDIQFRHYWHTWTIYVYVFMQYCLIMIKHWPFKIILLVLHFANSISPHISNLNIQDLNTHDLHTFKLL